MNVGQLLHCLSSEERLAPKMHNWPCTVPALWQGACQRGSAPLQGSAVGRAICALPLFPVQTEMCCTQTPLSCQDPCSRYVVVPTASSLGQTGWLCSREQEGILWMALYKTCPYLAWDIGTWEHPAHLPTALQISDPNTAILLPLGKSQKTREPSGVSVGGKSINSGLKLVRSNLPKTTQQVFDKAKPDGLSFWYEGPQRGPLIYPHPYFCPQHMHALDTGPRMLQPYSPYRTELLSMSHVLSIFQPLSRMLKTAPFLEPPCWEQQKSNSFMWYASSGERRRGRYFTNPAFRFYSF